MIKISVMEMNEFKYHSRDTCEPFPPNTAAYGYQKRVIARFCAFVRVATSNSHLRKHTENVLFILRRVS